MLNVSLTCKHLREATKRELFREYRNRTVGRSHPVSKFVYRILRKTELARYVKSVDIKGWNTLDSFDPRYFEVGPQSEKIREKKEVEFGKFLDPEPSEEEYHMLTRAAIAAGIIVEIFPYELESSIVRKATLMLSFDAAATLPNLFYTYLLDDAVPMENLPYDRRFCQLLRAGIDDAYAMLLFAILPNVHDIFLRGACRDQTALDWPKTKHRSNRSVDLELLAWTRR